MTSRGSELFQFIPRDWLDGNLISVQMPTFNLNQKLNLYQYYGNHDWQPQQP